MTTPVTPIVLKDTTANPAPIGLLGFGMTTILLNLHNAGFYGMNAMILGMGIFFGGLAQLLAGYLEWKKNNTFGATAFTAYGAFWLSLVVIVLLPKTSFGAGLAPDGPAMGWYLALWGLFTLCMFVGTLRLTGILKIIFLSLTVLFFLLAIGKFWPNEQLETLTGYEGIFCGFSAFYAGVASVINEVHGKDILPTGAKTS
jgi:succinate-acetate transporter protein